MALSVTGLLFEDISKSFDKIIANAGRMSDLPVEEFNKKVEERLEAIIEQFEDTTVNIYEQQYVLRWDKCLKSLTKVQRHIAKKNYEAFQLYYSYLGMGHKIIKRISALVSDLELTQTENIVIAQYAHLLRLTDQVGIMLLNGYDDGALILWRSFYEHALTLSLLIDTNDDGLTKRFIDHNIRNAKKKADSYESRREDLKFPPIKKEIIEDINERHTRLKTTISKEFVENDYGWADALFPKKRKATLRDIEDYMNWGKYRVYYIWASEYAHAGYETLAAHIEDGKIVLPSITEPRDEISRLIDPMQLTLGVLHNVNELFLYLVSANHEYDINLMMFRRIYDKLQAVFEKAEYEGDQYSL